MLISPFSLSKQKTVKPTKKYTPPVASLRYKSGDSSNLELIYKAITRLEEQRARLPALPAFKSLKERITTEIAGLQRRIPHEVDRFEKSADPLIPSIPSSVSKTISRAEMLDILKTLGGLTKKR